MMLHEYVNLFFFFIMTTAVLYLPIFFILKKKDEGFIRQLSYLLCLWSFFFIIFTTLILFNLPINFNPKRHVLNLIPLHWLWEGNLKQRITSEIGPNILIFIPFGFFAPIAFKQLRTFYRMALVAFILTFCIEFSQYFMGRSSDVDDLIANLLGAIIGFGIFKFFSPLLQLNQHTKALPDNKMD